MKVASLDEAMKRRAGDRERAARLGGGHQRLDYCLFRRVHTASEQSRGSAVCFFRQGASVSDLLSWTTSEAASWPVFHEKIDRLRELAAGAHRDGYSLTTGPLTAHTWSEL